MAEKIKSWKSDASLIRAQVAHGCIRKPKTKNRTSKSLRNQQRYIVPKQWTGFFGHLCQERLEQVHGRCLCLLAISDAAWSVRTDHLRQVGSSFA